MKITVHLLKNLFGLAVVLVVTLGLSCKAETQIIESPKQEDESLRVSLKGVEDSAHHLQEELHYIIYEITRQRYITASVPNVVGPTIIPAIPMPTGEIPVGEYLPPRQKYMTNFATQIQTLLTMLIEEESTLPTSDLLDKELVWDLVKIKSDSEDLRKQNQSLQALMQGSSFDHLAIGKIVLSMSDKLDEIRKLIKNTEHTIKKDIKIDP